MAQGREISVLHVDDDPDFAELTAAYLQREDDRIVVETAANATEGLQRLSEFHVDCIVSDYDMPGRDGIEFLEAVREDHPDVPFILFTGKGSEAVASEAISAGVTDYLQKQGGTSQYVLLANKITNAITTTRSRERAATVSRVRDVLRDVNQRLVRARSRDEIESAVCRTISQVDPYRLVWIGVDDGEPGEQIRPRASAGEATDYLKEVSPVIEATDTATVPTRRAFRDRELATAQSIPEDPPDDTWGAMARAYDIRGVAAIPLLYGDTLYGVLTVYSERAEFLDERERDLLVELGQDVAHAIHRVESERRYRSLFESNPAVVWVEDFSAVTAYVESLRGEVDDVEAYLEANPEEVRTVLDLIEVLDVSEQALDRYRAPSKEALMADVGALFTPEAHEANAELWRRLAAGETHFRVQTVAKTFDGDRIDEIIDVRVPEAHADDYSRVYLTAMDVTEREQRERKLEALHDVAADLEAGESVEYVCERTIEASRAILEFDLSVVDIEEDGILRNVALSEDIPERATSEMPIEEGIAGKTFRTGESLLIDDVEAYPDAKPQGPFNSGISVPIGEHGVFQAVAEESGAFDESDLELAELLVSHAESALDRLEHERRLERHNERLAEFASIVSHDLRNPLSVARGNVELVAQDYDAEALDAVMDAHERMATLIDDLLALTLERDGGIDVEPISLPELVDRCWETVATADATLVIETEQSVRADRSQLQHALENLFVNAVEHAGAEVTVTVGDLDDGFYVADDGPGILEDERSAVFDVGYSTDDGTGYGLAIVERAVEVHGWEINVTDSRDGGVRFEITGVTVE